MSKENMSDSNNCIKAYVQTPIGWLEIHGSTLGITKVRKVKAPGEESNDLPAHVQACKQQLREYFQRKRTDFDLPLDFGTATDFHKAAWNELLTIPYGHTANYSQIAEKLGDANKVRAVGQANRNNPIAIIVPCHRVIAKNGDLHGYFYGLDVKRKLLEIENPMSFAEQGSLF